MDLHLFELDLHINDLCSEFMNWICTFTSCVLNSRIGFAHLKIGLKIGFAHLWFGFALLHNERIGLTHLRIVFGIYELDCNCFL